MNLSSDGNQAQTDRNEEEEEIIPWTYVPVSVRQNLVKALTPKMPLSGNNWEMLANELGYTMADIHYFENDKENSCKALFNQYDTKHDASLNEVFWCLQKIKRNDCIQIITEAVSEIQQKRQQAKPIFHMGEFSESSHPGSVIQWSTNSCPCSYTSHPPVYNGHAYCLCSHSLTSCLGRTPHCATYQHPPVCHSLHSPTSPGNACLHCNMATVSHKCQTYNRNQTGPLPLPNNINPVDNSNLSNSSNSGSSLSIQHKMTGQNSEKCNALQHVNRNKRFRHNSPQGMELTEASSSPRQEYWGQNENRTSCINHSSTFVHSEQGESKRSNESCLNGRRGAIFGYSSLHHPVGVATGEGSVECESSLTHLQQLACVPDRFKPTHEYKTVVAEQKIEAGQRYKLGKESPKGCSTPQSSSSNSSCGSSCSGKYHSLTFPMSVKTKPDNSMEGFDRLNISKKSTSMPQDMKPDTFRKAFRHIKVFVTYSYDNEAHGKLVLSLCRFLMDNGFACCVDVNEKTSTSHPQRQMEWCRRKVLEADFVLICISPKYEEEIFKASSAVAASGERRLHTREIYELMERESRNSHRNAMLPNSQFVPLLFENRTLDGLPQWLRDGPAYAWPSQWMDLAWLLTKPAERIQSRGEVRASQSSSPRSQVLNNQGGIMCRS